MAQVNLSPAWDIYYMQTNTLFSSDNEVNVLYDREKMELKLYVDNDEKASALEELMPSEKDFGSVKLKIYVIPANGKVLKKWTGTNKDLFEAAFLGNPYFNFTKSVKLLYTNPMTFVVFKPIIAQYYTDNLGDWNGLKTELYSELPKEVFKELSGVYYNTDRLEDLNFNPWISA